MRTNLERAESEVPAVTLPFRIVAVQIRARPFHPAIDWTTLIATTTDGTTMADFADRSRGIGHAGRHPGAAEATLSLAEEA